MTTIQEPSDHLRALYQQVANWRFHAEQLYSFQQTQMLEWPSLSLDFLPDKKQLKQGFDYELQYLAVGTQALPGSQNYISVLEFAVALDEDDARDYYGFVDESSDEEGSGVEVPAGSEEGQNPARKQKPPEALFKNVKGHSRMDQIIMTEAPVLKLRAMPHKSDILAAKLSNGYVHVYNIANRPKFTSDVSYLVPDLRLKGHRLAGFGLAWNPTVPGLVASASDDARVLVWDIESQLDEVTDTESSFSGKATDVSPVSNFQKGHEEIIHDISWHCAQDHLMATCGDDKKVVMWDTRQTLPSQVITAHQGPVFGVAMHPTAIFQFATCGADRLAKLWDMRKTASPVHHLLYHSNAVTSVHWAPFSDSVLATAGNDRRVVLWDMQKIGQPAVDAGDTYAPPELSFMHSGHFSRVTDISWCPNLEDEWLMASVDMTNTLQLYKPLREVVYDYVNADAFDLDNEEEEG